MIGCWHLGRNLYEWVVNSFVKNLVNIFANNSQQLSAPLTHLTILAHRHNVKHCDRVVFATVGQCPADALG